MHEKHDISGLLLFKSYRLAIPQLLGSHSVTVRYTRLYNTRAFGAPLLNMGIMRQSLHCCLDGPALTRRRHPEGVTPPPREVWGYILPPPPPASTPSTHLLTSEGDYAAALVGSGWCTPVNSCCQHLVGWANR